MTVTNTFPRISTLSAIARGNKHAERGLTLIEIMIVLVIIGLVMAWFGTKMVGAGDKAKRSITELKIKQIAQYVEQFQLRYNALPQGVNELTGCSETTGASCMPIANKEELKDGWGNEFVYTLEEGGRRYRIMSYGGDGKAGGEAGDGDVFGTGP